MSSRESCGEMAIDGVAASEPGGSSMPLLMFANAWRRALSLALHRKALSFELGRTKPPKALEYGQCCRDTDEHMHYRNRLWLSWA